MYLVDGRRYEADERGLEHALAAAHDERIRPLCMCSEPPLPVYITRLGGTFVLKRMPFTGSQHAVGCAHYEPPADLSGLGEVFGTAISENPDTGVTQLRVGFSLSKRVHRSIDAGTGQESGSVRSDGKRLSLRGLLHFLWHEAELTRWHPGFAGRRTWAVVRSHLLAAATNKYVRGAPLADVLYVPEAFSVANRDEIDARRMRRFANGLQRHGPARPLMLLIGEVKEIVPMRFHSKVVVKHMPDQAVLLGSQLHRRMARRFERGLSLWSGSDAIRMVLIATFGLNAAGLPIIEELSLMAVTSQFLPVDDVFEAQLIERLVIDGRVFEKSLRFNAAAQLSASAIALDALGSPVPLCIQRVVGEARTSGGNCWVWDVGQAQMPSLPKRRAEGPSAPT